ncbi:MAG: AAA family ATPase [Candidatus Omnitrophica bacterium]|nr:AAA family ATPase [Candidatus Omnitrophota bacterium]MBI3020825.1 AAA family ATPase [Candidatus Omnitrophota bacterium]MBI3083593.1 AAA family ATPase [Candidatus Omnitrophota bacterium]
MSYYTVLGLEKEPFSTSPDPEFFYESREHRAALMRLLIEIRLKRGLSLILGDVGTGKTTLSRKLFQLLHERPDTIFHMILEPAYETEELFLDSLLRTFAMKLDTPNPSILDYREAIKTYLFQKGVEEDKTVVLLIDEAQKLNTLSLEILRGLLNYETNEYKLLQLVLLSQMELLPRLREIRNFLDRVSLKYVLNPLDEQGTKELIEFRLKQAGGDSGPSFFTEEAIGEIHRYTHGYPRQIARFCHHALRELVAESKPAVDAQIIRSLITREVR